MTFARPTSTGTPPAPAPAPRSDRSDRVLESALETFARFGFRKTSMEDVARAAEISRPGLYLLFDSKENLFRSAVAHVLERDLAAAEEVLAQTDRPLCERAVQAFDHWTGRHLGQVGSDAVLLLQQHPDLLQDLADDAPRRFEGMLGGAVREVVCPAVATAMTDAMLSLSLGLKARATSRADYLQRLTVGIDLLLGKIAFVATPPRARA